MAELDAITSIVRDTLVAGGFQAAICDYPFGGKMRHETPVVSVGIKSGSGVAAGFAEYLGQQYDSENDTYNELFGKKLDVVIGLHIYSPKSESFGADGCLSVFSEAASILSKLPGGLRIREITCGETEYDAAIGMFHCPVDLKCTAFMYAIKKEENDILDFTLKGVLVN